MKVDKNEFFREATLRICGNLEIENALYSLFQYLKDIMPVNKIYLQYFDDSLHSIRTIASADKEGGKPLYQITPMSKESTELNQNVPSDRDVFLIENPSEFPISKEMMNFHDSYGSSLIILAIRQKKNIIGYLVLQSEGEPKFSAECLEYVDLLKDPLFIATANALKHEEVIKLKNMLADDNKYFQQELMHKTGENIIGSNFGLKTVMKMVRQVADLDSPVLLLGETGTGKDVIANTIHYSSSRRDSPFINVNCGAIPDSLIDSELFGHEKGAFTGALTQKRGRFERADKGTIFLDEIGELPPQVQVRLLRVLQNKEIERVGGTKTIPIDIRIIAATNKNLEDMVNYGSFREDLWFRLNVFPIIIPPLRERKSDIPALLQYFLTEKSKELKLLYIPEIAPGSIDILMEYSWPGNVRELENVVERALILNKQGPINFKHLNQSEKQDNDLKTENNKYTGTLDDVLVTHIKKALQKTNGKIHGPGGAAELLGINANTLRNKMNKLGIEYGRKHGD